MRKLITTVGTSLFENYLREKEDIKGYYEKIKEASYSEYDEYESYAERIKKSVTNYYEKNLPDEAAAEIKSIRKIRDYLKDELEVYLIATDTVPSFLAATIIKEFIKKENLRVYFNLEKDIIKRLQVKNKEIFIHEGLSNLVRRIENIAGGYYKNVIFNISGGYKAVIPYLTLMAQINGCEMYYIFEDTDELIEIPPAPIALKEEIFEIYQEELIELEKGVENYPKWKEEHFKFVEEAKAFIETEGNVAFLSPIGEIMFTNYRNKYCLFYATEDVIEKIEKNATLKKVVTKFLCFDEIRKSKTLKKGVNEHIVYDDGDNDFRIFYSQKDNHFYIYAIFDYEPDEVKYLNDPKRSSRLEDYSFKIYKLEKDISSI